METLKFLEIRVQISFGGPPLQLLQRRDKVCGRDRLNFFSLEEPESVKHDSSEDSIFGVRHQQRQGMSLKG